MFDGKDRPTGLEYASCSGCNNGAGTTDQICALLGRIYPDNESAIAASDLKRILSGIKNNDPAFFQEISHILEGANPPDGETVTPEGAYTFTLGALAKSHLESFGARLGLAMHFESTGKILEPDGAVYVRIYTNSDLLNSPPPDALFDVIFPRTLQQGKKQAFDQFRYDYGALPDGSASLCFASFRQSYSLLALAISSKRTDLATSLKGKAKAFRPGLFHCN